MSPLNIIRGLECSGTFKVFTNSSYDLNSFRPNSAISNIFLSWSLPITKLSGLFLECETRQNYVQSFLTQYDSSSSLLSNGDNSCFLEKIKPKSCFI